MEVMQAVPSAARNASGSAPAGQVGSAVLTVFAASGTAPTLDLAIEETSDGATWREVARFVQMTGPGQDARRLRVTVAPLGIVVRYRWTISAGASFTFAVMEIR